MRPSRETIGGNGGPALDASPLAQIMHIGLACYGERSWIPELAGDLSEHPRQVHRWIKGQGTPPGEEIAAKAKAAWRDRIARLGRQIDRIKKAIGEE
jgi:hypothetical protein